LGGYTVVGVPENVPCSLPAGTRGTGGVALRLVFDAVDTGLARLSLVPDSSAVFGANGAVVNGSVRLLPPGALFVPTAWR
jgi:hypothetical protein